MRIIKHGAINLKTFECSKCGCIFEADITEYKYHRECIYPDYVDIYTCECPDCNNIVEKQLWETENI